MTNRSGTNSGDLPAPTGTGRLRLPSTPSKPSAAPSKPSEPAQPSNPPSSVDGTDLTIVVDDGHATTTWRLTCTPAGGTHPTAEQACQALAAHGAMALPPVPKGMNCAMIYGGPQRARITGTWQGRRVDSTMSRTNGCEIARWDALDGLLPGGGA